MTVPVRFFLWSGDTLLGAVTEIPGAPAAGPVTGFFHPTDAFATVGAPLAELGASAPELLAAAGEAIGPPPSEPMSRLDRVRELQRSLAESPGMRRLVELYNRVAALKLELRDESGAVLPTQTIAVQHLPEALSGDLARAALAAGVEVSDLILVAPLIS